MKVLSLYDGMACGMLALNAANIHVERYVAYEIDKYAISTVAHNFPKVQHRGDVFGGDFAEYSGFDYLMGGSPCTKWSIAQKNNRETEASGIGWEWFCQYVRALQEAKPRYFIYENNKSMSNAIRDSISQAFGFDAVLINSALVSAQHRQRLYWVGKRNEDGTYSKVDIEQPKDRGFLVEDVLETKGKRISCYGIEDKARPIGASYARKGCGEGSLAFDCFPDNPNKQRFDYVAEPVAVNTTVFGDKAHTIKAQYYKNGIANFVTNGGFGATAVAEPIRVGSLPRPNGELSQSQAFRIYDIEGKSVNLTSGGGGAGGKTGLYAVPVDAPTYAEPCEWDEDGKPIKAISYADGKVYQVYEVKNGLITIKDKEYPIKLDDGFYIIRKLTVKECMRLQTVPEWYEFPVSDTQAYKMLGNGWTVDVIAHILKQINEKEQIR